MNVTINGIEISDVTNENEYIEKNRHLIWYKGSVPTKEVSKLDRLMSDYEPFIHKGRVVVIDSMEYQNFGGDTTYVDIILEVSKQPLEQLSFTVKRLAKEIESREKHLDKSIEALQLMCPHKNVYRAPYKEIFSTSRPFRVCVDCGLIEESWGVGNKILSPNEIRDVIPEVSREEAARLSRKALGGATGLRLRDADEKHDYINRRTKLIQQRGVKDVNDLTYPPRADEDE